jgi:hypothetical protein
MAQRNEDALRAADELGRMESLDGLALYNLACVYLRTGAPERGMQQLRLAVQKGFRNIDTLRRDPDLDPLRGTAEFEELMRELSEP